MEVFEQRYAHDFCAPREAAAAAAVLDFRSVAFMVAFFCELFCFKSTCVLTSCPSDILRPGSDSVLQHIFKERVSLHQSIESKNVYLAAL